MSTCTSAIRPAMSSVAAPRPAARSSITYAFSTSGWQRTTRYTPAVHTVPGGIRALPPRAPGGPGGDRVGSRPAVGRRGEHSCVVELAGVLDEQEERERHRRV